MAALHTGSGERVPLDGHAVPVLLDALGHGNGRSQGQAGGPVSVQASAGSVAEHAEHVRINSTHLDTAATTILASMHAVSYSTAQWSNNALHPKTKDEATVDWIFLIDLLNYSFWHERSCKGQHTVVFEGTPYKGYWSLCASIQRALKEGVPVASPAFWAEASHDDLAYVFRPSDPDTSDAMPMLDKRVEMLQRAGRILVQKFQGRFVNCIAQANKSGQRLMQIVTHHFGDMFEDAAEYKGRRVWFNKRLQILVADLWACFEGTSFGEFHDISSITMFADYRVPQALVHFGILEYSQTLQDTLRRHEAYHSMPVSESQSQTELTAENAQHMLPYGHPYEVEIRGCSIWAVELLVGRIQQKMSCSPDTANMTINPIIVDFYLWDEAYKNQAGMSHIAIHRTRSIYY
ncbi:UPF0553 protein C9orf64-like protein [Entophlyctis helioformis]|nr:UPF0553 protein C9orf64-like protein [Entophlyctis helioformis]